MKKQIEDEQGIESKIREVMSVLGKRSAEARQKKWGKKAFVERMRKYGNLGGRPKKTRREGDQ